MIIAELTLVDKINIDRFTIIMIGSTLQKKKRVDTGHDSVMIGGRNTHPEAHPNTHPNTHHDWLNLYLLTTFRQSCHGVYLGELILLCCVCLQ